MHHILRYPLTYSLLFGIVTFIALVSLALVTGGIIGPCNNGNVNRWAVIPLIPAYLGLFCCPIESLSGLAGILCGVTFYWGIWFVGLVTTKRLLVTRPNLQAEVAHQVRPVHDDGPPLP